MEIISAEFDDRKEANDAMDALRKAGILRDVSLLCAAPRPPHILSGRGIESGSTLGGLVGMIAGMSTIMMPGLGEFAAAGPIAGLLCGSVTGGITGSLVSLGLSERESESFARDVVDGKVLFSMETAEESAGEVEALLRAHRAQLITKKPLSVRGDEGLLPQ